MLYRHNKKEQDQLPAHTYKEVQKGKKKSSVLIQLSGWLRTLDMVRVAGLEPVQSCLHKNLNLARLPIPPYPHIKFCPLNFTRRGHPRRSLLSDKSTFGLFRKYKNAVLRFYRFRRGRIIGHGICRFAARYNI